MTSMEPRVSIGLPTYNRPELLSLVLVCFREQSFADFELIISDNASSNPEVRRLCERYAALDSRFRYVRQPVNQGAEKNFWFVYDQARAPLFMWASDDDLWPSDFLEKAVAALDKNPHASAWFCHVVNINIDGDMVRSYPSFRRFQSTAFKFVDLVRFLWEPEIMGKANLIYSVFRKRSLRDVVEIFRDLPPSWGSDMNIVYGFLCRSDVLVDDRLVLRKRVPTRMLDHVHDPRLHTYPLEERATYFRNYRLAAAGTGYRLMTATILGARSAYDYWYSGRLRHGYENLPLKRHAEDWSKHNARRFIRATRRICARLLASPRE